MPHEYEAMRSIEARMQTQETRTMQLSTEVLALKKSMDTNTESLQEFIELAKVFRFGLKLLGFLERIAVFITKFTIAGGAVWATWKFLVREALAHIFH